MALLWAEPFDIYGSDETNMFDGVWAEITHGGPTDDPSLTTVQKRTGTHSLLMPGTASGLATTIARRVLGGAKTKAGVGGAYYLTSLPASNNQLGYCEFRDGANTRQITAYIQSTGVIAARTSAGELDDTATPAIVADAWNHIETMAQINNTTGAFEVRVNEVTVLNLTGVDTQSTSNVETSQIAMGRFGLDGSGTSPEWYVDDMFAWDDQTVGTNDIVDFVGDKKVFVLTTNADTAEADFSKSTGVTGYTLIDELTPDDSDYIYSATDGHVSEFELSDLPGNAAEVIAVIPMPRLYKTDAGTVTHAADLISNSVATAATAIPATTEATYWPFVHTKNPDTGAPWTPAELNAALLRITRAVP